jgi:hypothetical protein
MDPLKQDKPDGDINYEASWSRVLAAQLAFAPGTTRPRPPFYRPDGSQLFSPAGIEMKLNQKEPDWDGYMVDTTPLTTEPVDLNDPRFRAFIGEYRYHRFSMLRERAKLSLNPKWLLVLAEVFDKGPIQYQDLDAPMRSSVPFMLEFDLLCWVYTKEDKSGCLLACSRYGMEALHRYQKEHPPT